MALIVCGRTPVRLEETTACVSWRHAVFLALLPLPWPPVAPAPVRCPACPSRRRHWAPSQAQAQARPLVLTPCSYRGGGWGAVSDVFVSAAYRCGVRPQSRQAGLNLALSGDSEPTHLSHSKQQLRNIFFFLNAAEFDISFIQNGKQACSHCQIGIGA